MSATPKISVVVTTFNSEEVIAACLESVRWADEIIVVDSFSTDGTLGICRNHGVTIYQRRYTTPAEQKSWGIDRATNRWVLLLDSDEQVSPELQSEILSTLGLVETAHGYKIPRRNFVFGVPLRFSGYAPDYQVRLFLRPHGSYGHQLVHEQLEIDGAIGTLKNPLVHHTHRTVAQTIDTLIFRWAPLEAQKRNTAGYKYSIIQHIFRTIGAFLYRFIVLQGFRDGLRGYIVSGIWSLYLFVTYAYLWEIQTKQDSPALSSDSFHQTPSRTLSTCREPLTIIIPCGNNVDVIKDCLESARWAEELLVVDSFSNDGTREIAEQYADRILQHEYVDSATQKNWVIPQATHNWVSILDTDERISLALKAEIESVLSNPAYQGYKIPRLNVGWGRVLKHGDLYPDYQLRLFQKNSRYENKRVHAHIIPNGRVGVLENSIIHMGQRSIEQTTQHLLGKFTAWEAEERSKNSSGFRLIDLVGRPTAAFLLRYLFRFGLLDGIQGFLMAGYWSWYLFVSYLKIWESKSAKHAS